MTYKIVHRTEYLFDAEVFLEPHYFRFRPKSTAFIEVKDHKLVLTPQPAGNRVLEDEENNRINFCWFNGTNTKLSILSESVLEIHAFNPFHFLIHPKEFNQIPFKYGVQEGLLLMASLEKQHIPNSVLHYGSKLLESAKFDTVSYLSKLTYQLHQDFSVVYREEGPPLAPGKTFENKEGSCRDLSWMQIQLLRHQGIAARFVSGYYYFEMEQPSYELHAWVEVYLPGTGWLGIDPSHGILTGNTHFPIAASAFPEYTMPVSGGIRGSASSQLTTHLSIEIM